MDPFIQELIKLAPSLAILMWTIYRLEQRIAEKDALLNQIFQEHCVTEEHEKPPSD